MSEYIIRTTNMPEHILEAVSAWYEIDCEIVRCRDCVHYKPYRTHKHGIMNRCYDENGHTHRRDESDFCSRGERRSE